MPRHDFIPLGGFDIGMKMLVEQQLTFTTERQSQCPKALAVPFEIVPLLLPQAMLGIWARADGGGA
jgi:hypothetical protein